MNIKKKYFTFQKAIDNANEFEIIFNPTGHDGWHSSPDPSALCKFFKIDKNDYFRIAQQHGAKFYEAALNKFIYYDTIRFSNKKDARKFINEYLVHYITIMQLMEN